MISSNLQGVESQKIISTKLKLIIHKPNWQVSLLTYIQGDLILITAQMFINR